MTGEVETVRQDLRDFRGEVNSRFSGLQKVIEGMAGSLRDLVRVDSDLRATNEALGRIGREVEEIKKDHEERLRALEQKPGKRFDRLIDRALSALTGAAVAGAVAWYSLQAAGPVAGGG